MTAQVVVMNMEAIALASDSAITVTEENGGGEGRQKIFTSGNKLFALSKYEPVGIMVYGSAEFMYVPFEAIIKVYRQKLGSRSFRTLNEYAGDFMKFLDNGNPIFPDIIQDRFAEETVYYYFSYVKDLVTQRVQAIISDRGRISRKAIKEITAQVVSEQYLMWRTTPNIPSIPRSFNRQVLQKYSGIIRAAIQEVLEKLPLSRQDLAKLMKTGANLFSKCPKEIERQERCGVVIAGFGTEEMFPSLESFDLEGIVGDRLKYKPRLSTKISFDLIGSVVPFAQGEMVRTFMEGIAPDCSEIEASSVSQTFVEYADTITDVLDKYDDNEKHKIKERIVSIGDKVLEGLTQKLDDYRREHHTDPITTVVAVLPKDELAAMAESFVYLTSLKRRYTMETETVGGAIDVAVISKGDGLVWIKRKHYFKPELNPGFLQRYYREKL